MIKKINSLCTLFWIIDEGWIELLVHLLFQCLDWVWHGSIRSALVRVGHRGCRLWSEGGRKDRVADHWEDHDSRCCGGRGPGLDSEREKRNWDWVPEEWFKILINRRWTISMGCTSPFVDFLRCMNTACVRFAGGERNIKQAGAKIIVFSRLLISWGMNFCLPSSKHSLPSSSSAWVKIIWWHWYLDIRTC